MLRMDAHLMRDEAAPKMGHPAVRLLEEWADPTLRDEATKDGAPEFVKV